MTWDEELAQSALHRAFKRFQEHKPEPGSLDALGYMVEECAAAIRAARLHEQQAHRGEKFPPLAADHPMITDGTLCAGCTKPFAAGDITTLIGVGPGGDPEAREKARSGRAYTAVAFAAHWACVTGEEA